MEKNNNHEVVIMNNKAPIGTLFPTRIPSPLIPATFAKSMVRTNFDEMVEDLFSNFFGNSQSMKDKLISKGKMPKADILVREENGNKKLTFQIAVPGLDAKDINIDANFEEGTISVSYQKENFEEKSGKENEAEYICRELSHSSFFRSWSIPNETIKFKTEEDVKISLNQGVLTIDLDYVEKDKLLKSEKENPNVKRLKIK